MEGRRVYAGIQEMTPKVKTEMTPKVKIKTGAPLRNRSRFILLHLPFISSWQQASPRTHIWLFDRPAAVKVALQKDKKPKRSTWKFNLDLTNPVEDGNGIFDSGKFEQFLREKVKVNGKTGNLGDVIHLERFKNKITITIPDLKFLQMYLKYLTKKYLKKNNLDHWLHTVASDKETYELQYFQISQDEDGSESED
ncbi:60S ribosomal protein L22-like 1 [Octodon degus]|uniref:60S ribosomal protein L22-like 1 n=1 Tax=Octodon degus TaxID=10160 RepID=A0A6P3VE24_OCTDE|nr:60S ribosomal protein L22-like 1 [Octodon degus]